MQTANIDSNTDADILSGVLRSIRLRGSVFFCSKLSSPWGMTLNKTEHPRFHIVLEGSCWLQTSDMSEPLMLQEGDTVLITHGNAHWIADNPNSNRIASDEAAAAYQQGKPLFRGNTVSTRLLCGRFHLDTRVQHPLITTLPATIRMTNMEATERSWLHQTALLIAEGLEQQQAGVDVLIDRICEVLFVQIMRSNSTLQNSDTGFLSALYDPSLNRALQCIHAQPSHNWTVESLAARCHVSRSAFAHRFQQRIGIAPIAYLTLWRMQNALCLLRDTPLSLTQIAEHLGYSSDMALAKAFKRFYGETPGAMRKTMRDEFLLSTANTA
ncbi:MAG: AraC family transcriptional regulator [Gammaproteobacteria bacterium]|nr:AraC family transcriptional regulator [Gammaproteobacteria bacterium]